MMGKTIDSIEYYTTNGLYTIDVNDLYVPVKFAKTEDAVKVADADISAGKTAIEPVSYTHLDVYKRQA